MTDAIWAELNQIQRERQCLRERINELEIELELCVMNMTGAKPVLSKADGRYINRELNEIINKTAVLEKRQEELINMLNRHN